MARGYATIVSDAPLEKLAECDRLDVVSDVAAPVDLSNSLAFTVMIPGDGNGDYSIADDPTTGRRLTIAAKSAVATTVAGTGAHLVLSLAGVIRGFGPCSGDDLVFPGTTNISTFYAREAAPVAPV